VEQIMSEAVEQRVAVVTGGAGAIGSAIAQALAEEGLRVVVLDRAGDVPCDLADAASTQAAAATVLERYGRCDILVHAAAVFNPGHLDVDLSTWRHVQAVNVEAALLLCQGFAPGMRARSFGRVVLIGSDTAFRPPAEVSLPYVVSKAALIGLTRALAVELGPDGIAVTAVAPGLTDTPAARTLNTDAMFDAAVATQALARRLTPGDVAASVRFLVSDGAAALTGQVLCIDGGTVFR
jgi:NAD(P)-dependent dehydrogenase (short-subunit alcohol dehydrogenase family)